MTGVYLSEATAPASWSESTDARQAFGPKAADLMLLPRAWTLPFILVPASQTRGLLPPAPLDDFFAEKLQSLAGQGRQIIVRSSVVGETIWERGTYKSIVVNLAAQDWIAAFQAACTEVINSAGNREARFNHSSLERCSKKRSRFAKVKQSRKDELS